MILVLALVCGMVQTAGADVITLGIYFCGRRTAEDGSQQIVRLDGRFRVTQNGEEIGVIQAGKETLTLTDTARVRIEPMPESISPEWDLSDAVKTVYPEAGGTMTVSITVEQMMQDLSVPTPEPTPEPPAESNP